MSHDLKEKRSDSPRLDGDTAIADRLLALTEVLHQASSELSAIVQTLRDEEASNRGDSDGTQ